MSTNLQGVSYIGYSRGGKQGEPARAVNAADQAALKPDYFWATPEEVSRAAKLAASAFLEYRSWPAKRRAEFLRRIAVLIESNAATLVERANQETALPAARLQGEIARTCGQLNLFATLLEQGWWQHIRIDHANPERKPLPKPDVRSLVIPLGPVAVFSSSNFPFAFSVAGGDTASALAAGCTVIVKPHQGHLGTSEQVGSLVQQAAREMGAPDGIFSLLFGPGRDVGIALVKHPLIKAVGFTGSRAGGRALMDAAAARPEPIPVYAEMGSINPVFILPGIMEKAGETLAGGLHGSVTLGVGQFCTNPGLVFLEPNPASEAFLKKLETLMEATAPAPMLTASISTEYQAGIDRFSKISGVHRLTQMKSAPGAAGSAGRATLFVTEAQVFLKNTELMDEVFGPSTLVVQCGSKEQLFKAAERLEGQLTATVHGTPEDFAANRDLLQLLETRVGRLVCNGFPTGVEVCHAMNHGGPYPATADGRSTSVGTRAIERFVRPLCYQNFPEAALPDELKEANPLGLWRLVDGRVGQH
jgi:NADP-dependent aldehyde dehydrogenase